MNDLVLTRQQVHARLNRNGFPVFDFKESFEFRPRIFKRCFIQLGRYGDLLIVLRALKLIHDWTGRKPSIIVSQKYADILDGFTYVDPIIVNCDWYGGMPQAQTVARSMFGTDYAVLQCHGLDWGVDTNETENFMSSMWLRTGVPMRFYHDAKLVVDRRDIERENALLKHIVGNKPVLLFNLTGISSPFRHIAQVKTVLGHFSSQFNLVNLNKVRGARLYDLLGLYERSIGLVTIDTSTLHLAHATDIPVIAFTVDGWTGSTPPTNTIFRCQYSHALHRLGEFQRVIRGLLNKQTITMKLFHAYCDYVPRDSETQRRMDLAKLSWKTQPWTEVPLRDGEMPRMFDDGIRKVPYIKDMLDMACNGKSGDDVIVLTNSDIHVRSDISRRIEEAMNNSDAAYCFRRDFHHRITQPIEDHMFVRGHDYAGSDLYVFKVKWWNEHKYEYPDMLNGTEAWDAVMRVLIEKTNWGKKVMMKDVIAHERHGSTWEASANRYSLPSQKHNLRLAWEWFMNRNIDPTRYGLKQI